MRFLFCLFFSFFVVSVGVLLAQDGLCGAYTIGGDGPDFPSFTAASEALSEFGLSGEVVFNVRDGLYDEQIELPEIRGASENHTITFQSESSDPNSVYLYHGDVRAESYHVIWLNGADWFIFKDISIENTLLKTYSYAILLTNGATHNRIENNIIRGQYDIYEDETRAGIYSRDANNTHNAVVSNKILASGYGILWEGSFETDTINSYVEIIGNEFSEQSYTGLGLDRIKKATIAKNKFEQQVTGIRINDCLDTIAIHQNDIESKYSAIYNLRSYVEIFNNFIKSTHSTGVFAREVPALKCFNNNFHIGGIEGGHAFDFFYSNGLSFVNNNIFVKNTLALRLISSDENNYLDYNNYYSEGGSDLIYVIENGSQVYYPDLAAWQITDRDAHSISINPKYIDEKDLHTRQADLNGTGIFLTGVTTDIDDEIRDTTTPDIGADEFIPTPSDVGIAQILTPEQPFSEGIHPIEIILLNQGTTTLENATIAWAINGIEQTPLFWTGTLEPDDSLIVHLADVNFTLAEQPYQFSVQSSLPNGNTDNYVPNNYAETLKIYLGLAGIYTIGGEDADFKNMNHAAQTLNKVGILDAVTFNIRKGVYNEQFIIQNIQGANENRRVTFQSEEQDSTSVVLTYNNFIQDTSNYLIKIENAAWLNWKHLTLSSRNRVYGNVLQMSNTFGAQHFESNRFIGPLYTDNLITISTPTHDLSSQYDFINNYFINGSRGIDYVGLDNDRTAIFLSHNVFDNQHQIGLSLIKAATVDIFENRFTSFDNNARGIHLEAIKTRLAIDKNYIHIVKGFGGIYLKDINIIENRTVLSNNFIQIGSATYFGIKVENCRKVDFYFNTVRAHFMSVPSYYESACFYLSSGSSFFVYNNNFSCTGEGYAMRVNLSPSFLILDHNNLFSKDFSVVRRNNDFYDDLAAWQQLGYGDLNSISEDPFFLSETGYHANSEALNGAGIGILGITDDLDDDTRNSPPDIGADEFVLYDLVALQISPLSSTCDFSDAEAIAVQIKNNGQRIADDFTLTYQIDNQSPVTELFTNQSLMTNEERTYQFQTLADFSEERIYDLKVFLQLENNDNEVDDILNISIEHYSSDTTYLYELTCDPTAVTSTATLLQNQYNCDSLIIDSTILDNLPPVANCKNLNLDLASHETVLITAADLNDNSTDNCQVMDLSSNMTSFDCEQLGENTVTLTVTDAANNQSNCTSNITLHDTGLPRPDCIDFLEIALLAEEAYVLEVSTLNANSQDYCTAPEDLILSFSSFEHRSSLEIDCDDIGIERFELWVTDEAGNQDHCVVNVEIQKGDRDCTCDEENIIFENENIPPATYKAAFQIEAAGQVNGNDPNLPTIFRAGESISLLAGFEVVLGSSFVADIETCFIDETLVEHTEEVSNRSSQDVFNTEKIALKVVPNPFKNEALIQYEIGEGQAVEISLYSISGTFLKLVQAQTWQDKGQYNITLAGEELQAGIYLLQWQSAKHRVVEKVIVR